METVDSEQSEMDVTSKRKVSSKKRKKKTAKGKGITFIYKNIYLLHVSCIVSLNWEN